ncbi:helix-turn-helix domain-containing protein [Streptococcus hongkongensis]
MSGQKSLFARNLKYLRLKNNMDQLELAVYLGRKSASSISEWEKGKYSPKQEILFNIASLFKVTLDELTAIDLEARQNYPLPERHLQDIQMISEQLEPPLFQKLLNYGEELLEKQNQESE